MSQHSRPVQAVIEQFASLPGLGLRSAERIAFHLLTLPEDQALRLADAIRALKTKIRHCDVCYNLAEAPPPDAPDPRALCEICANPARDPGMVCVVEQPKDLVAIEDSGLYRGVYHVLLGRLAPLEGVEPGDVTIPALLKRLESGVVRELIMATNPTLEGDGTALYLQRVVQQRFPDVTITRLARGVPTGSSIEHANRNMLADALAGRQRMG